MNSLSDLIAWGSERNDIDIKMYEMIANDSLAAIFKLYDEATDGELIRDQKLHLHVRAVIADKLELPQRDIIVPFISDLFGALNDRLDKIEKNFASHRHDASKSYTEKPAW